MTMGVSASEIITETSTFEWKKKAIFTRVTQIRFPGAISYVLPLGALLENNLAFSIAALPKKHQVKHMLEVRTNLPNVLCLTRFCL
jgi:hypothetical protein